MANVHPDPNLEKAKVFEIDAGFGNRLIVRVFEPENNDRPFVQFHDPDRDSIISIDDDIWFRIANAVEGRLKA